MTRERRTSDTALSLARVRASLGRVQAEGERMVKRLRRDAEALMERTRGEVVKEVRDLERRVLKALHGATKEQVTRLERRIASLERAVSEMHRPAA
jgi:hypothetical protein